MKKRSIKFEVNFTNKWLYTFIALGVVLLLAIGVFAYNSGKPASVFGHSAGELEGVCLTNGTGCPIFEKGISSCRIKEVSRSSKTMDLCCDVGEFLTGVNSPEDHFSAIFWQNSTNNAFCSKTYDYTGDRKFQIICCK